MLNNQENIVINRTVSGKLNWSVAAHIVQKNTKVTESQTEHRSVLKNGFVEIQFRKLIVR